MKKEYIRMVMTPAGVELSAAVLTGSNSKKAIKVNEVTVEDFTSGFKTDTHPDDFETIDFD